MNPPSLATFALTASLALVLSVATSGCITFGAFDDDLDDGDQQTSTAEADPVLIRAVEDGDETVMEHLSSEEVFERAYYAFQARRYEEASENYALIVEYFPDSRFYLPALYNGGLAFERLENWEEAARFFTIVVNNFADTEEGLNAHYRLAQVRMELGEYQAVIDQLDQLRADQDLEYFDQVEAQLLQGLAMLELEEWDDALTLLEDLRQTNEELPFSERLQPDHRFIVQTNLGIGRAKHGLMNEIDLVLPPDQMRVDLETKADLHQDAQLSYIRALREHHPTWSVAAGYKIGRLYQDFYMDVFVAEIPDDLNDEELTFYFSELREQTQVLMDKGMRVYERNLSFSRRIADGDQAAEWVDATTLHMERMRAFLEDPLVQARAEELVVQGGDIDALWDPTYYAQHHIDEAFEQARQSQQSAADSEIAPDDSETSPETGNSDRSSDGDDDDDQDIVDQDDSDGESSSDGAATDASLGQQLSGNAAADQFRGPINIDMHHPILVQKGHFVAQ